MKKLEIVDQWGIDQYGILGRARLVYGQTCYDKVDQFEIVYYNFRTDPWGVRRVGLFNWTLRDAIRDWAEEQEEIHGKAEQDHTANQK